MTSQLRVLHGIRILSLALNLPGPAALMRCCAMGATCVKLEPPSGDPMRHYNRPAYQQLHEGVKVVEADLKTEAGQKVLAAELTKSDVLMTSFRPSALHKLGLGWKQLHTSYPNLSQVAIVGAAGARAEEPGHDLTYLADHGLVPGLELPATLYADMSGSLMASEAVLQAALVRNERYAGSGENHPQGVFIEVALADAAHYLSLPRQWGLTARDGAVGGAHAGYAIYPCRDGRVAVAALEPHFAAALSKVASVQAADPSMRAAATRETIAAFFARHDRAGLERLARQHDLPLHCME